MEVLELYVKEISPNGKVSYKLFSPEQKEPNFEVPEFYSNKQLVTWAAALGLIQLQILNKLVPEHTLLARKDRITNVIMAIKALVYGLGEPIPPGLADYVCDTWNLAMRLMQSGLVKKYEMCKPESEGCKKSC